MGSCLRQGFTTKQYMIFEHLPGVETMMDDIVVWGSTREEHDARVKGVLELARKSNLKIL